MGDDDGKEDLEGAEEGGQQEIRVSENGAVKAKKVREGSIYYDEDGNIVKISRRLPKMKRGGCGGDCPYNELWLVIIFLLVLYGCMAALFIALSVANASTSTFGVLWAFFAIFCVFVAGIIIVSVKQYQRTHPKKVLNKSEGLEENEDSEDESLHVIELGRGSEDESKHEIELGRSVVLRENGSPYSSEPDVFLEIFGDKSAFNVFGNAEETKSGPEFNNTNFHS